MRVNAGIAAVCDTVSISTSSEAAMFPTDQPCIEPKAPSLRSLAIASRMAESGQFAGTLCQQGD